jgi:uncharacterized protein YxeA
MKKILTVFIAMLFIASLSFAVVGCGKIEEDSANLQKAVKELKAKEDAKKAAAEVKDAAKDAPKAAASEVKNTAKPAAK